MPRMCPRCGLAADTPSHNRVCEKVPPPRQLANEFNESGMAHQDLAAKYGVGNDFIVRHLRSVGAEKLYRTATKRITCRRCSISIFDEDDAGDVPSSWSLSVQRNNDGLCPGCATHEELGYEPTLPGGGISFNRKSMGRVKSAT